MIKDKSNNLMFLGDISFNDKYKELYRNRINPFNNIEKIPKEVTTGQSPTLKDSPTTQFPN